jgi:hypothetical protein
VREFVNACMQANEAHLQRKAAEKRLRDLEGELDGRRMFYDKVAQLCEDKKYRDLIVELQREVQAWASNTHKQRHTNHPFLSILNTLSTMHALARTHARTCACSQARNAETRKEAAVSKMEQANMDLARLKSSAARSAAMQQKEYEMRYEALRTKVQESEKQVREG